MKLFVKLQFVSLRYCLKKKCKQWRQSALSRFNLCENEQTVRYRRLFKGWSRIHANTWYLKTRRYHWAQIMILRKQFTNHKNLPMLWNWILKTWNKNKKIKGRPIWGSIEKASFCNSLNFYSKENLLHTASRWIF